MSSQCIINNCQRPVHVKSRGWCRAHYLRWWFHNDVNIDSPREPRKAIIKKDYALIPLGLNAKHGYAIIDIDDVQKVEQYQWTSGKPYAISGKYKYRRLHILIIGKPPKGMFVDHINRDKLDNRRSNLRYVTPKQNSHNTGIGKRNTTGYKGVGFDKDRNKWVVQIAINGKNTTIGRYDSREIAYEARLKAEEKYYV